MTGNILCTIIDHSELRNWALLIFGLIGAFVTIRTFINSTRQRKIDNTYKTIDFLRKHIADEQIQTFIYLFHANNELSGVKYNEFRLKDGRTDTIETMFSEGGCGNGDIHNMIELFNLISPTLNELEAKIIWYEYGQIMNKIYGWTKYLSDEARKQKNYKEGNEFYLEFNKFMEKNWNKMLFMPTKYYTYAE